MILDTKTVGLWFFALIRRRPFVFAIIALIGILAGIILVCDDGEPRWVIVGLGTAIIVFYSVLLVFWAVTLCRGTWKEYCTWMESLFLLPGPATPANVVKHLNAQVRALPCPQCNQFLAGNEPGKRTQTALVM